MDHDLWDEPIEVVIGPGDHFKSIGGSRDALAYLMTCWPQKGGDSFALAKRACMEAADGRGDPSTAASAFRVAAGDVGILR
ncbi:DUF982 domain-containing protein [Neorhizobium galegae]|uniref:DUF982 domain-containing protein n=1 Tax=Neorhizobium galegae TaxID=399 RepID=UPI0006214FD1|nr:DUF982 domain-containing protein [Neorhizobium galegae]CDZ61716.1 Hypothetical protein NGAL_HAMBI2566_46800 [Neorhizobium galegae bv. orientalis]KAB1121221.1 DUF982 domain-containing protein [Neorhizobium galegae]MCQ1571598.1 DUF982 domain-containing protein [Neorhizobium galegae]MCQ1807367.1 DUF982 domain-containing protein [Neorhizobium galegae]MCQ1837777.1 DUF982 domain-containing protein [Neorhizobium galegae]